MKSGLQVSIIVIALITLAAAIFKMSAETTTIILPLWLVISAVSSVACVVSIGIGVFLKDLLRSGWHQLTFASICLLVIAGVYLIVKNKPTLNVIIPPSYGGEIKLLVSTDSIETDVVIVNLYGIGYITKKDFERGFYLKILKGGVDVSKQVKEYSKESSLNSLSDRYSFDWLSFSVLGRSSTRAGDIDELLRTGAIDTLRLPRKSVH